MSYSVLIELLIKFNIRFKIDVGNDDAWICAKDICQFLGYKCHKSAIKHCVNEKNKRLMYHYTTSGIQKMTFINIEGLYELLSKGRKKKNPNQKGNIY